jgi:hypothetical protein
MGRYFARPALILAVGAIFLAGFVDVTTPSDELDAASLRQATLGKGLVLSNAETMKAQRDFVGEVTSAAVPEHSVVMTGFIFPQLAVREREALQARILERDYDAISMLSDRGEAVDPGRDVRYVWLLTYDKFLELRAEGYSVFVVRDASKSVASLYGYHPTLLGASYLNIEHAGPGAGKGTATTDR